MDNYIYVASLDDIPKRGARSVKIGEKIIAIFRTQNDNIYATDNKCPHKGGPLCEGLVHDEKVTCPLHSHIFCLKTGKSADSNGERVKTYEIIVKNGQIFLNPFTNLSNN